MSIKQQVTDLISLVEQGRMIEAIEKYYDENVAMQENLGAPTVGLAANLDRERAFYGSLQKLQFKAASVLIEGNRAVINWVFDFTAADGKEFHMDQVAIQAWRNGKLVHERFIYDTATLAVAA